MIRCLSIVAGLAVISNAALLAVADSRRSLRDSLFPEQRAAIDDPNTKKVIWTSGRAGKTTGVITDFMADGLEHERYKYAFIALTRQNAEEIAWPILQEIDQRHKVGCRFQEAKLRAILPTGSAITLYGADRPGWMNRLYGIKLRKAAIDEAAFYSIDLIRLIDDIIEPRLADLDGQLYLMSIPGLIPAGPFYELTKHWSYEETFNGRVPPATKAFPMGPEWTVHRWTTDQNPHMRRQHRALLDRKKKINPDIVKDPHFIRNHLGGWAIETGERVYQFDSEKNRFEGEWKRRDGDQYILGIDFGWDDYQAFSVNVWREDLPYFVELESMRLKHALLDEIYSYVKMYQDYYGQEMLIVADPAHKQLFEEFRRRFDVPVIPAEKSSKFDWQAVWNSSARAGDVKIQNPESSPHVEEMQHLTWKVNPQTGWKVEQPGRTNDCCDAHLLAFRHSYHYRFEEEPAIPDPGTPEADAIEEEEILERILKEEESAEPEPWYA